MLGVHIYNILKYEIIFIIRISIIIESLIHIIKQILSDITVVIQYI